MAGKGDRWRLGIPQKDYSDKLSKIFETKEEPKPQTPPDPPERDRKDT
jgi:hypothetical protein